MLGAALLLAIAVPAAANGSATVASTKADHVALTVYRAPGRGARDAMNLRYLGGFALVTETRTIRLPAGDAVLRFEGVAGGIIPASAIVTGLPGGTIEKNRDARLLSPAALIDGTLGRRVMLRRTDKISGATREEQAEIVAGPGNGVVLKTESGIVTLGCSGLGEGLRYGAVPAGLSAKPVLSVLTRSSKETTATVSLSYLASGFDWSASYVATVAPDGRTLDLFAWLTLANDNGESFANADVQAVAGRIERRYVQEIAAAAAKLELRCYPLGTTTSDLKTIERYRPDERRLYENDDIMVTAMRMPAMTAAISGPAAPPPPPPPPEDLGDLKLYRVPRAVTVAAKAQKQVALLAQPRVAFEKLYRIQLWPWAAATDTSATITLRMRNDTASGLGIPLPAGTTTLYRQAGEERQLLGLGTIGDTAKGGRAKLAAGVSRQLLATQTIDGRQRRILLTNANPFAVPAEVAIGEAGDMPFDTPGTKLERIDGIQTWRISVPANGSAQLDYALPVRKR